MADTEKPGKAVLESAQKYQKSVKNFFGEFRDFAMKGNVIDLAVGVIIGGAFNTIVTSLVNDVIMPLLGIVLGRVNISELTATITGIPGAKPIVLKYGNFLQNVLNFLIVAFSIFLMIKVINKLHFKQKAEEEAEETAKEEAKLSKSEELLTEIRDLMQMQRGETPKS